MAKSRKSNKSSKKRRTPRVIERPHRTGGSTSKTGTPLFELEVCVFQGMITEAFAKRNPVLLRTIQIRGDQTLENLHEAIFRAFDRFDPHMYEFQIGGKGPMDPKARRYVLEMAMENDWSDPSPAGVVNQTRIDALGLKKNDVFAYWFDFGDDWWHQIDVAAIHDNIPPGRYPKITSRTGESPPQYPDFDEEDDEDDDGDDA